MRSNMLKLYDYTIFNDRSDNIQILSELRYLLKYFNAYSGLRLYNLKLETRKQTIRHKKRITSQRIRYDLYEVNKTLWSFWYWAAQHMHSGNMCWLGAIRSKNRLLSLSAYYKFNNILRPGKFLHDNFIKNINYEISSARNLWKLNSCTALRIFLNSSTKYITCNIYMIYKNRHFKLFQFNNRRLIFISWIALNFMNNIVYYKKHTYNYLINSRTEYMDTETSNVDFFRAESYTMQIDYKTHVFYAISDLMSVSDMYTADISGSYYDNTNLVIKSNKRDIQFVDKTSDNLFSLTSLVYTKSDIPKIQFEPGWPTFFRRLRHDYSMTASLRFNYQWRLTRYLLRFRKLSNMARLNVETFGLKMILVFTKFYSTIAQARESILRGNFYVNGCIVFLPEFQLQPGDHIMMIINYQNYNYLVNQLYNRSKILTEGINIITGMQSKSNIKLFNSVDNDYSVTDNFDRIRLSRMLRVYYAIYDVPRYVELDFITLSFVVLYNPHSFSDFDYFIVRRAAISTIKILNWKYIV